MASKKHELSNNYLALLELVRAGLWADNGSQFSVHGSVDWTIVYQTAEAQGVMGLVAAGIERLNVSLLLAVKLQFVGSTLQIEQRNKAMNAFIADIVERMRAEGIYTLLVKGQGVAQCYEKSLWRPSGDVDFLLSDDNYPKAVALFKTLYDNYKNGGNYSKEYAFYSDQWMIELHGSLRTGLSSKIDKVIDAVQNSVFYGGNVRSWQNGKTQVFLPAPTEDVFLVFTHFIKHFYKEGMSLRQVCDWCRLLWTYKETLNYDLLEKWIKKSGLMTEWAVFGTLAVNWLGMPEDAMPTLGSGLMVHGSRFEKKAERLLEFILNGSHGKIKDTYEIAKIFPWQTLKFLPSIFLNVNGLKIKERLFQR
ncbi:MAG: nucleotidyltransferase family protein [Bacteroidaceae bacterium]|nr:nucleotidyltransferase family protein [Bacteroidaceae bacterium]